MEIILTALVTVLLSFIFGISFAAAFVVILLNSKKARKAYMSLAMKMTAKIMEDVVEDPSSLELFTE